MNNFVLFTSILISSVLTAEQQHIEKIIVEGFNKTETRVIIREIGFQEGDTVSEEAIQDGLQNLENTRIFYELDLELQGTPEHQIVRISGKDRWTTIPIFKVASGGGTTQIITGIYDANVLGKYFELGSQYERLGETNSGVFWYKDKWFTGKKLFLDFQLWKTNRLRTKYFQDRLEPLEKMGFLHTRTKAYLGLSKEFTKNLSIGMYLEKDYDEFSKKYVEEKIIKLNAPLPPNNNTQFVGLKMDFGQLKYRDFLIDGALLNFDFKNGFVEGDKARDFHTLESTFYYYKTLPLESTFAYRAQAGATNTETLQYWFYLGGLDRVRGFADNRFAGRYYWLANAEFRIPSYKSSQFVLQHVVFYDAAAVAEMSEDLKGATGASVGTGLRFIFPKIYRLVARLDFAKNLVRRDELPVSFGVQQFF